jgi:hypothetical protein
MIAWLFDEREMEIALTHWGDRVAQTSELQEKHVQYMKASVLAFLYSPELSPFRDGTSEEKKDDEHSH